MRWRNIGSFQDQTFDLLVTVPTLPSLYSERIVVAYTRPLTAGVQQALSFGSFACLGVGILTSACASGSGLDATTAECSDGTPITMYGSEFEMQFVRSGSSDAMPAFERFYISFFDVDGDSVDGFSVYELQAVLGAVSLETAPMSTLEAVSYTHLTLPTICSV